MSDRQARRQAAKAEREAALAAALAAAQRRAAIRRRIAWTASGAGVLAACGVGLAIVLGGTSEREPAPRPVAAIPAAKTTDLRTAAKAAGAASSRTTGSSARATT